MKISLKWLKSYGGKELDGPVIKLVEKIGEQLGAVDEVIDWGKRYDKIITARVVSCEPHPNADKLHVCLIDDRKKTKGVKRNKAGYVQVVCGAPNVAAGQIVAWLPPGASVPSSYDSKPLVLEARNIRGVVSNGMIGSGSELALSDDHSGIVVLDDKVKPGTPLKELFELDDTIIDIENKMFTHRPDCFGLLGVAREIAGIQHTAFKSPKWYLVPVSLPASRSPLPLEIRNDAPELVPRLMAVGVSSVTVESSPLWLQSYLLRVGIRPINNIVDITNYVMYLTGQPLHAYDYDKLRALDGGKTASLIARKSRKGEKVTLLGGKTIAVEPGTIVIASKKELVGIGGVMGGGDTEVGKNTRNVVLECANFDMYSIRRASMAHGLSTDAVTRFTKGQSPRQNPQVLAKTVAMISELAGGQPASKVFDEHGPLTATKAVKVDAAFVNKRLGLKLSAIEMSKLLKNVEFEVQVNDDAMRVLAPFWRTDVQIPEDIVEEIGRLYGYGQLPLSLPPRDLKPVRQNELLAFKHTLRETLSRAGANEVLTYSFVHGNLLTNVGQDPAHAYKLANALSPELHYYRPSLTPSLLSLVHMNLRAGSDMFTIFEIGKGHIKGHMSVKEPGIPQEEERLSLVFAADDRLAARQFPGAAFYQARTYLDYLLTKLGIAYTITVVEKVSHSLVATTLQAPFELSRSGNVWAETENGKQLLGVIGEPSVSARHALKLPAACAGFELEILGLLKYRALGSRYQPLPRFPKVEQDICLRVPGTVSYRQLTDVVRSALEDSLPNDASANLWPIDIFQSDKDTKHKNITYRVMVASYQRTLTTDEVNALLDNLAAQAKKALGATRV